MSKYEDLTYMENIAFGMCQYSKASAIIEPLRHAINSARALPAGSMEAVIAILETGLEHIRGADNEEEVILAPDTEDLLLSGVDPLDQLLGPA